MSETNGPASETDLQRLAARVAMLASDPGEADNAGRAVGLLARRIGLTGGDLKRIFLAGAATETTPGRAAPDSPYGLEREVLDLRRSVHALNADAETAEVERDALLAKVDALQVGLRQARRRARFWTWTAGGAAAALLVCVGLLLAGGPAPAPGADPARGAGAAVAGPRLAVVRQGGAALYRGPDRQGAALANLPAGTRVLVRRLVWQALIQWAEIEIPGGRSGYVLTTEVDLS